MDKLLLNLVPKTSMEAYLIELLRQQEYVSDKMLKMVTDETKVTAEDIVRYKLVEAVLKRLIQEPQTMQSAEVHIMDIANIMRETNGLK